VEARSNPDYLQAISDAVAEFRSALVGFLKLHEVNEFVARGIAPAVFPKDKAKPADIALLQTAVSQAAGRASAATSLTGSWIMVQGVGRVDPIAAWFSMTQPHPVLEAGDVLNACDQMIGQLASMILKAKAEAPPTIGAEAMHPLIWGPAGPLWRDHHYRQAVGAAAEALVAQVKVRTGRNDVPETALWQEVLSDKTPEVGKPRLRWPGDPKDRDVRNMTDGLRQFAPGVQMLIRNTVIHGTSELQQQPALERLATLSLLATWISQCELDEATP
jgi:hypothetical protein